MTRVWPRVFLPQAFIALGFWLSRSTDTLWLLIAVSCVGGLCLLMLRLFAHEPDGGAAPEAVAIVLSATVLLEIGALLVVRLVVVPDPEVPFGGGSSGMAWEAGWSALIEPVLVVGLLLVAYWLVWRPAMAGSIRGRIRRVADAQIDRANSEPNGGRPASGVKALLRAALVCAVVVLPFLLPLVNDSGGGAGAAGLTFAGIATPEFGKLLFVGVLAVVVARESHHADGALAVQLLRQLRQMWRDRRTYPITGRAALTRAFHIMRFVLLPLGWFALVAACSALRHDFGTLISVLAATIAITWAATRQFVRRRSAGFGAGGRPRALLRRTVAAYQLFLAIGVVLLGLTSVVAVGFTDYVHERAQVWSDPWVYRWGAGCVPSTQPPAVDLPPGLSFCQRSLAADTESERSQVAAALSAIADGGIWGRGLRDTASGTVPAGSTDFVLAVMWDKLGGFVVLGCALLVVLLGAALRRAIPPPPDRDDPGPTPARLFATGLAGMIVGQFLFVFAATLNVLPHSGIPAPFLSRGGQSTLALLLAVTAVLGAAQAVRQRQDTTIARRPAAGYPQAPARPIGERPGISLGTLVPAMLCLAAAVSITVFPYPAPIPAHGVLPMAYADARPRCPGRGEDAAGLTAPAPDPATCSNDQIAYLRTRIAVLFNGHPGLAQVRPAGVWQPVPSANLNGLTVADLAGLLRVGPAGAGVVDLSYPEVVYGSAGTSLARRLGPPSAGTEPDGSLSLTVDPALQHVAATALRTDGGGGIGPLAGAIVVVDARTGAILVSATAPGESGASVTADPAQAGAAGDRFLATHGGYARPGPDGTLDGSAADPACRREGSDADAQAKCWRWSVEQTPPAGVGDDAVLRRYVANDSGVDLPSPMVNRALGKWYGLGSTFKVVIAATYLENSRGSATDLLPAPSTLVLAPGVVIHNAGGGRCPGTSGDGMITLTQALAVSCNTAFVGLAERVGWPAIAAQAAKLGFRVGTCDGAPAWLANAIVGAVASCVPADADEVSIGNDALGGQDVQGTPLQLAGVMAAVANAGKAMRPVLVSAVRTPGSAGPTRTSGSDPETAFSARTAEQLKKALSRTAVDGTAAGLQATLHTDIWVKTGTMEVVPAGEPLPPGQFVRQDAWITGFLDIPTGPVGFAAVVETRDEKAGAHQVRFLAQTICQALVRR